MLRRRKGEVEEERKGEVEEESKTKLKEEEKNTGNYWLTRVIFFRFLGLIYFVAFLVALHQNEGLVGESGLTPFPIFLSRVESHFKQQLGPQQTDADRRWHLFQNLPTLFWAFPESHWTNESLNLVAWVGCGISCFVCVTGCANAVLMFSLWILYHSLVAIGQRWYGFGWESQLLETGFLAIFSVPLLSLKQFPLDSPTPWITYYGYRWLVFRIMLGAGLIKIRGDQCWRDLTCMYYHYQTQPVPSPLSWYFHNTPAWFHMFECLVNHFVELVAPFMLLPFLPRFVLIAGGLIQIFFQVLLILSGNLSFLNWLTLIPAIWCLDDEFFRQITFGFYDSTFSKLRDLRASHEILQPRKRQLGYFSIRSIVNICIFILVAVLSYPVLLNLLSSNQAMNTSFDNFRIVNTYGAFGSVTKVRTEIVFQGSEDGAIWKEYEFKCKPGNVSRRPCFITPYHYRLDWLAWFAAFQDYQSSPWVVHLAVKLLQDDKEVLGLMSHNPFPDGPPKLLRIEHYEYEFAPRNSSDWWVRRHLKSYLPPISLDSPSVWRFLEAHGFALGRNKT